MHVAYIQLRNKTTHANISTYTDTSTLTNKLITHKTHKTTKNTNSYAHACMRIHHAPTQTTHTCMRPAQIQITVSAWLFQLERLQRPEQRELCRLVKRDDYAIL